MGLEDEGAVSNEASPAETTTAEESSKIELSQVSSSLHNLNLNEKNANEVRNEAKSPQKDEQVKKGQYTPEESLTETDKEESNTESEKNEDYKEQRELNGSMSNAASSEEPMSEHYTFGIEGIFDAMKSYYDDKSPFLPTGVLDTELLRQKLLQETPEPQRNMDEDSIFYDRCLLNSNYWKSPPFNAGMFPKLSVETYFYVFYNVPRDTMQQMAANELFKRQWKYQENNKLWFKQDQKKATWVYFDPSSWTTRPINLTPEVENSLMSKPDLDQALESLEQNN